MAVDAVGDLRAAQRRCEKTTANSREQWKTICRIPVDWSGDQGQWCGRKQTQRRWDIWRSQPPDALKRKNMKVATRVRKLGSPGHGWLRFVGLRISGSDLLHARSSCLRSFSEPWILELRSPQTAPFDTDDFRSIINYVEKLGCKRWIASIRWSHTETQVFYVENPAGSEGKTTAGRLPASRIH